MIQERVQVAQQSVVMFAVRKLEEEEVTVVRMSSRIHKLGKVEELMVLQVGGGASVCGIVAGAGPKWNNQRLYPPMLKAKSIAWKFGGFFKEQGRLDLQQTVCGLCGKKQRYRQTPTNLMQHVQANHVLKYTAIVEGRSKVTTTSDTPKIDSFFSKKQKKLNQNDPKQKKFVRKLSEWIIQSNRALVEVEDEKLVEAFELADPRLQMPRRGKVRSEINLMWRSEKTSWENEVSQIEFLSGNNDAGTGLNKKSFIAINVSYVTEDFHFKKKILDVVDIPENKNAINYRKRIRGCEEEHGIAGKVFIYTTDNEPTMKAAFREDARNGCFAHIESKASKKALDKQECLQKLRRKLRKISKKASKSSKFNLRIALFDHQKLLSSTQRFRL